ncbi:5-dehydro-4-deoxy-D-glucuronate isomerase, partial [Rhizobium ruizarguesonis]
LAERELGALNIGGSGRIIVDVTRYDLAKYDCLYAGKGARDIRFDSADAADPAKFYLVSTPAHQAHPTVLLTRENARHLTPGEAATANKRSIYQF